MAPIRAAATYKFGIGGAAFQATKVSVPCTSRLSSQTFVVRKRWPEPSGWIAYDGRGRRWAQCHHLRKNQRRRGDCTDHGTSLILPALASSKCSVMKEQEWGNSQQRRDGRARGSDAGPAARSLQCCEEEGLAENIDPHLKGVLSSGWWQASKEASWGRAAFCGLTAFLLLLGTLETPDVAVAEPQLQDISESTFRHRETVRVHEILSELSDAEMPEAGSPDVGQTSLFSAENEELAADLFEVRTKQGVISHVSVSDCAIMKVEISLDKASRHRGCLDYSSWHRKAMWDGP